MGRSVSCLSNAEYVIYFTANWIGQNENNEYDEMQGEWDWDDFKLNLISSICHKLKSYSECNKWDNNETLIFVENNLCQIGISEYCDLYSLSIQVKEDYYSKNPYQESFGKHHAEQVKNTLEKCLIESGGELLNRIGTFSNGCGVFEKNKGYYENAERVV